jgi:hypothetical protein
MLLSKTQNEMNDEEKLKLKICRSIAISKGIDVDSQSINIDFRKGGTFWNAADSIVKNFDIKLKEKNKAEIIDKEKQEEVLEKVEEYLNEKTEEGIKIENKKIEQWSIDGKTLIGTFSSFEEVLEKTQIDARPACEHEKVSIKGFSWKYENETWKDWIKLREEFKKSLL